MITQDRVPRKSPKKDGKGTPVMLRCQPDFLERVDDWRSRQRPIPTRPEAIRALASRAMEQ